DGVNWSCAYDSLFMILYHLFRSDRLPLESQPGFQNEPVMCSLHAAFTTLSNSTVPPPVGLPERLRDTVRDVLHRLPDLQLPRYGRYKASLDRLLKRVFPLDDPFAIETHRCTACHVAHQVDSDRFKSYIFLATSQHFSRAVYTRGVSTEEIVKKLLLGDTAIPPCASCHAVAVERNVQFVISPLLLTVEIQVTDLLMPTVLISHELNLSEFGSASWTLNGVIYLGDGHFTSRVIDRELRVWSHDGLSQSNCALLSGQLGDPAVDLLHFNGRRACCLIY
ncbi:hypothetical protein BC629DRAFT_1253731, partial [Irpex lacteus]